MLSHVGSACACVCLACFLVLLSSAGCFFSVCVLFARVLCSWLTFNSVFAYSVFVLGVHVTFLCVFFSIVFFVFFCVSVFLCVCVCVCVFCFLVHLCFRVFVLAVEFCHRRRLRGCPTGAPGGLTEWLVNMRCVSVRVSRALSLQNGSPVLGTNYLEI